MSKILITGNGFDLFHHLPTKYHHFISIMETIEQNYYAVDVSFDELFGGVFQTKYQFEYDLIVENYSVNNILFSQNKLNRINELLRTNLWYKYFKTVLGIDTWIDFEIEVEVVLKQISILINSENANSKKTNYFRDVPVIFEDLRIFNIIDIQNSNVFRVKSGYLNYRDGSINSKKILEDLAKSFEDFIVIFNRYLVDVVRVFYAEIKQKSSIPFHLIDKIYTFNYTPSLERIYNVDTLKMVYLHGKINEDCEKQNLVLGVSEISDEIKGLKAYDFTKYYQKIKRNTNQKFVNFPKANTLYDEETFFYIVGHSLDKSDKEYILELFRFLEQDKLNKSKICVFYYDNNDRDAKIKNLLSIIDEKIISRMNRENRLCFVELNNVNLEKEFKGILYKHQVVY